MTDFHPVLNAVADRLAALRKLRDKVDPASGISVMVRRGVLHDSPEEESGEATPREWISVEPAYQEEAILDLLIQSQETSLKRWIKWARTEADALHADAAKADRLLPVVIIPEKKS